MDISKIANNLVAGHSFKIDRMEVMIWGKQPFNVDVMDELRKQYFDFKDDEGGEHDDGTLDLKSHVSAKGGLTYQQEKQGLVRETYLSFAIPDGAKDAAFKAVESALKKFKMKAELLSSMREPKVRKANTVKGSEAMNKKLVASELVKIAKLLIKADEMSPAQKEYREFFNDKMDEHDIDSPSDLSDEDKKDFFDDVKTDWAKE